MDKNLSDKKFMKTIVSPSISVVTSVYNCEKYLRESINSILSQTFNDFEFIIIDDGSIDSSIDIINSFNDSRIKLLRQENRGLAFALNEGIKKARGKYIARMDADDICLPDRFQKQFDFLEHNPDYVVVGSNAHRMDMKGNYLCTSSMPISWEEIKTVLPQAPFYHSSTMFRKDVFFKCGEYSEIIKNHFEDWLLWNKMSKEGKFYNIEIPLIKYRVVPGSLSKRNKKTKDLMLKTGMDILRGKTISDEEKALLNKLTKKKSNFLIISDYYLQIGKTYIEFNFNRLKAFINITKSITFYPFNYVSWFNLFLLLLPHSWIKKWKKTRYS